MYINHSTVKLDIKIFFPSLIMEMATGLWMALLAGILPVLCWILWWWNDLRYTLGGDTKLPPGYMGLPFLGDMPAFLWYFKFLGRPDDYINSKRSSYGDGGLYRTHLFGSPSIIAFNPSDIKFVMQNESLFSLVWPSSKVVGPTALISVEGPSHTRVRRLLMRAINQPDALHHIALVVQPRIVSALNLWAQKGRIRAYKEVKKVTFENIGKYFASLEPGPVLDTLDELFMGIANGLRAQPLNIPGTAHHRALQCRKKATAIFIEEMERRRKSDASDPKHDILEGLMQMKDEDGKRLSDTEVLDNIVSVVVAGYASTTLSIMWSIYYLAKYPDVLKRLREEHMLIAKKLNGEFIKYEDIAASKYTSNVVEEVIRLANIAGFVFRNTKEDVEYKGYKIPKGWKVICWLRYLHANPENFEDPMCFNPDRWNVPPKSGTNLMFGLGSRLCPGNMLARLQVSVLLHHLVTGYRWELVNPGAEMNYLPHPKPADDVEINISKI